MLQSNKIILVKNISLLLLVPLKTNKVLFFFFRILGGLFTLSFESSHSFFYFLIEV